jgi:hypothetical protein
MNNYKHLKEVRYEEKYILGNGGGCGYRCCQLHK